jgi:hypothetical protein
MFCAIQYGCATSKTPKEQSQKETSSSTEANPQAAKAFIKSWIDENESSEGFLMIPTKRGAQLQGEFNKLLGVDKNNNGNFVVKAEFSQLNNTYEVVYYLEPTGQDFKLLEYYLLKLNGRQVAEPRQ